MLRDRRQNQVKQTKHPSTDQRKHVRTRCQRKRLETSHEGLEATQQSRPSPRINN